MTGREPSRAAFRTDIEGLRAIAIVLVVLFHAGVAQVPGGYIGVDMFFVLSGYLITGIVHREVDGTGGLSFVAFYARRARRLMPASALVLFATLAGSVLVFSPLEVRDIARSASAVSVYASNIFFARQATDYLAATHEADPFLQTWSLAVEEQFYFLWPALLLGLGVLAHRLARRRTTVTGLAAVALVSFVACVVVTQVRQPWAFFLTPFRVWEFAIGGIAALLPWSRLRAVRAERWLGPLGLVAIGACAALFDETTTFPGAIVAVPAVATAAVLVAGSSSAGAASPSARLLGLGAFQWVGRHSYSWYLWHWPLLIFVLAARPATSTAGQLGVMAVALAASVATFRFLEHPVRESAWLRARPRASIAGGLVLAGACLAASLAVGWRATTELDRPDQRRIVAAADDISPIYPDGCAVGYETAEPITDGCAYGDVDSDTTIVLFGDSHAAHLLPALDRAGKEHGWKVVAQVKDACPSVDLPIGFHLQLGRTYRECGEWREAVMALLRDDPPDLVVISNLVDGNTAGPDPLPTWRGAVRRTLDALDGNGTPVLLVSDVPAPGTEVPVCLSRAASATLLPAPDCSFDRDGTVNRPFAAIDEAVAADTDAAQAIDLAPLVCPERDCSYDRDGTILFSDANHLTATFAATLAPPLADAIESQLTPDR